MDAFLTEVTAWLLFIFVLRVQIFLQKGSAEHKVKMGRPQILYLYNKFELTRVTRSASAYFLNSNNLARKANFKFIGGFYKDPSYKYQYFLLEEY